ncbi:hypothetical protein BGZ97_003317 [Linnemannia gamsii]|jgi:hypothetical protein|uniref:F-box domain-containing protein n=1 Tax=Linnemannia gamsii TaxID=64522 RepID=A0A9P6RHH6_9FUNG|nr:hypothetical protein BGZ97_003317 [Linnemannia gamsii]
MDKALTLPEILACIGNRLDNNNIISCMQVCKSWRSEFEPLLWRSFTFGQLAPKEPRPELPLLQKNALHIRQLVIEHMDPTFQSFFMQCKQLDEVRFDVQEVDKGDDEDQIWGRFSDMIDNHGRLRKIVIDSVPWPITNKVLETMERCSKLIVLETKDVELDVAKTQLYLKLCSKNLKRLSTYTDYYDHPEFPNDLVFQEMRYLDICHATGISMDKQLTWLSRCPNLISFRWEAWVGLVDVAKLSTILSNGACPNLTALHLIVALTDEEIAQILEAAPRIEKLSLPRTGFGARSIAALRRHFPTLRDINLQFCSKVTSPMVQEILRSCANLQSISAEALNRSDIIQQPWACKGLQMFDVGIDVVEENGDYELLMTHYRDVYQRLGQLKELDYLSICSGNQMDMYSRNPIKVSLEAGLDELAPLTKLTFFSCKTLLDSSEDGEGFEAVEWMVEHWKKLETFEASGLVTAMVPGGDEDDILEPSVMDLLKDHGIKFTEFISSPRGLYDEDADFYEGDGWTDQEDNDDYGYDMDDFETYEHFGPIDFSSDDEYADQYTQYMHFAMMGLE